MNKFIECDLFKVSDISKEMIVISCLDFLPAKFIIQTRPRASVCLKWIYNVGIHKMCMTSYIQTKEKWFYGFCPTPPDYTQPNLVAQVLSGCPMSSLVWRHRDFSCIFQNAGMMKVVLFSCFLGNYKSGKQDCRCADSLCCLKQNDYPLKFSAKPCYLDLCYRAQRSNFINRNLLIEKLLDHVENSFYFVGVTYTLMNIHQYVIVSIYLCLSVSFSTQATDDVKCFQRSS